MRLPVLCSVAIAVLLAATESHASLVAYWSFDSDFTATAGGTDFDLTAVNGATAGDAGGKFGNAATFERANSEYAVTSGNVLTPGSDFSYSAWYKTSIDEEAGIQGGDRYFVLETSAADGISGAGAWTASIGLRDNGGSDNVEVFTHPSLSVGQSPITLGVWQNVVVTFDNDGGTNPGTGLMNAYLDGVLFATADNLGTRTAVEGLVIGGHREGTGRNFEGQIDAVSFYDSVLTETQIGALQTTAAIPEPSTLALVGLGLVGLFVGRRSIVG